MIRTEVKVGIGACTRPGRRWPRASGWARLALGLVLVWTGCAKIVSPAAFADSLWSTGFFAKGVVPAVAYGVPALEIVLGLAMAWRTTAMLALPVVLAFSTCFTLLHAYLIATGTLVPCGCAGVKASYDQQSTQIVMVAVSAAMLMLSTGLLIAPFRRLHHVRNADQDPAAQPTTGSQSDHGQ